MPINTERGRFHAAITAYPNHRKKQIERAKTYYSCDPLAVAVAMDPSMVLESEQRYCLVERAGQFTRGQMVVDYRGHLGRKPNVELVMKIDIEKVKRLYIAMLKDQTP